MKIYKGKSVRWHLKKLTERDILLKSLDRVRTGFAVSISNRTHFSLVYDAAIWPVSVLINVTEVGLPTSKNQKIKIDYHKK